MVTDKMVGAARAAYSTATGCNDTPHVLDGWIEGALRAALEAALSASDANISNRIADAIEECDWSGTSIGNKEILKAAVRELRIRAALVSPADTSQEPVNETPKSEHVSGGAYRRISVDEWRSLGGDSNKLCDWHEGIGYVIYDDQALSEFKARCEELAAAPKEASRG